MKTELHWNPTARWPLLPKYLPGQWMWLAGPEDYMDGFEFKDEYFMDLTELLPEDAHRAFGKQG